MTDALSKVQSGTVAVLYKLCDDTILFRRLLLQFYHLRLRRAELLLQGLDTTELFGLHDHCIVRVVHRVIRLKVKSVDRLNGGSTV